MIYRNHSLYFIFIPLFVLQMNCHSLGTAVPASKKYGIFQPLEDAALKEKWGTGYETKARIFTEIYRQYGNDPDFERQLFAYLDHIDKYYWISFYLDNSYYTNIGNYTLSLKVLKRGLAQIPFNDPERIPFLWTIGRKMYFNGEKNESLLYLREADFLSSKFPGYTPAWNSENEYIEITDFIKSRMIKKEREPIEPEGIE